MTIDVPYQAIRFEEDRACLRTYVQERRIRGTWTLEKPEVGEPYYDLAQYARGDRVEMRFTRTVKRWEFPVERFVEYGPKDEDWCRLLGIGHEVESVETTYVPNAYVESVVTLESRRCELVFTALASPLQLLT